MHELSFAYGVLLYWRLIMKYYKYDYYAESLEKYYYSQAINHDLMLQDMIYRSPSPKYEAHRQEIKLKVQTYCDIYTLRRDFNRKVYDRFLEDLQKCRVLYSLINSIYKDTLRKCIAANLPIREYVPSYGKFKEKIKLWKSMQDKDELKSSLFNNFTTAFFDLASVVRLSVLYNVANYWWEEIIPEFEHCRNTMFIDDCALTCNGFSIYSKTFNQDNNKDYQPMSKWQALHEDKDIAAYERSRCSYRYELVFPLNYVEYKLFTNRQLTSIVDVKVVPNSELDEAFDIYVYYIKEIKHQTSDNLVQQYSLSEALQSTEHSSKKPVRKGKKWI